MMTRKTWALALATILVGSSGFAQQQPQTQGERQRREDGSRTKVSGSSHGKMLMTDDKIATLLLISAQDCAQLSQMVAEKTKNEKVRSFAEQRAQASQKMVQQLQPFAGQRSRRAATELCAKSRPGKARD
jgi:predicted outer membrane protein